MSAPYEDPRARDRADREAGQATIHEEHLADELRDGFWEWGKAVTDARERWISRARSQGDAEI